jgi:hypothetical protein
MANVPASIISRYWNSNHWAQLGIGKKYYPPQGDGSKPFYWYTIVDLTDLSVPDVAVSTANDTVPANIARYLGNTQYFLFFASNAQGSQNIPHGQLWDFLKQVGSGPALKRGEQMIDQLGTGNIVHFSYVLAATMNVADLPGFEAFSPDVSCILTMEFMPVTVNGKTYYAPIQVGSQSTSAHDHHSITLSEP